MMSLYYYYLPRVIFCTLLTSFELLALLETQADDGPEGSDEEDVVTDQEDHVLPEASQIKTKELLENQRSGHVEGNALDVIDQLSLGDLVDGQGLETVLEHGEVLDPGESLGNLF